MSKTNKTKKPNKEVIYLVTTYDNTGDAYMPNIIAATNDIAYAEKVVADVKRAIGADAEIDEVHTDKWHFHPLRCDYSIRILRRVWSHPELYQHDPEFKPVEYDIWVNQVSFQVLNKAKPFVPVKANQWVYTPKVNNHLVANEEDITGYFQFESMEDAQKKSEEYLSAVKKSEWGNIESMSQNLGNKVVVDNSDFLYDKLWQVIGEIGKNKTDDQYNILVGRELIDGYKITSFVRDPKQPDDLRKRCDGMRITVSNGKHTETYYRAVDSLNYKGE